MNVSNGIKEPVFISHCFSIRMKISYAFLPYLGIFLYSYKKHTVGRATALNISSEPIKWNKFLIWTINSEMNIIQHQKRAVNKSRIKHCYVKYITDYSALCNFRFEYNCCFRFLSCWRDECFINIFFSSTSPETVSYRSLNPSPDKTRIEESTPNVRLQITRTKEIISASTFEISGSPSNRG